MHLKARNLTRKCVHSLNLVPSDSLRNDHEGTPAPPGLERWLCRSLTLIYAPVLTLGVDKNFKIRLRVSTLEPLNETVNTEINAILKPSGRILHQATRTYFSRITGL